MSGRPLVHVIDDDAGMRHSLQMLLESESFATRTYESAERFLEEAGLDRPGCILLDLKMPGMGGLKLLQRLMELDSIWPVIVISGHADVTAAVRSMKLGAVDLLQKPIEPRALVEAVGRATENFVEANARRVERESARRKIATLTPRERELMKRVVAGESNKQIAAALAISIKTVANHRASLMTKVGAINAPDLSRLSMIAGL